MSWSFNIETGDLSFVSNMSGAAVVTGQQKTFQDLKSALLEQMGSDPMHPEYGSLLDGGVLPNGTIVDSFIGRDETYIYKIQEEIARVIQFFNERQSTRINSDLATFGKSTVSDSEIVESIESITNQTFGDKLVIQVHLLMRNGNTFSITQPMG